MLLIKIYTYNNKINNYNKNKINMSKGYYLLKEIIKKNQEKI